VRVLTADGEPAVHAIVVVEQTLFSDQPPDRLDWALLDSLVITDAEGRARAQIGPSEHRHWRVTAARPGEWGGSVVERDAGEITIRLRATSD
jgi:hypothetical protein